MDQEQRDSYRAFLAERRSQLVERIEAAAARAGRDPHEVELLAVSKTVGDAEVELAHEVGYSLFGENRPQELKRKAGAVAVNPALADVRFHMIGNLQKNKINQVLDNAELVHSVSSLHLAAAIASRASARGMVVPCLLEVNVSGEGSKSGFAPSQAEAAVLEVSGLEGIELKGLMTMAPARDAQAARRTFSGLRDLRDGLRARTGVGLDVLSCGMSGDFEIAVEEGSTLVRLGRIVFDPAYEDV